MKIDTEDWLKLRETHIGRVYARNNNKGITYAEVWKNKKGTKVHRIIIDAAPELQVDHVNHDGLDNRRGNLREVTNGENQANRGVLKNNTTGVTGVYWRKETGKWRAMIGTNKGLLRLGQFADKQAAIAARKDAERKYFGEFAYRAKEGLS